MRDALHIPACKETEADGWISGFQQNGEAGMGTPLDCICDSEGDMPYLDYLQAHH